MANTQINSNAAVISPMLLEIERVGHSYPEYFQRFDDSNVNTAPQAELLDLMAAAPTDAVKFFLFGVYTMRVAINSVTGRSSS